MSGRRGKYVKYEICNTYSFMNCVYFCCDYEAVQGSLCITMLHRSSYLQPHSPITKFMPQAMGAKAHTNPFVGS